MSITKKVLEEAVLDVLYVKSIERPLWVNASEVYWSLPFADVSEREVTAMLTELIEEQRVKLYLGKYQLSKEELVRLKEQAREREQEEQKGEMQEERAEGNEAQKPHQETQEAKPFCQTCHTLHLLAVFLLGLVLGGLSWAICSSAFSSDVASLPHETSLETLQQRLEKLQTGQVLQGYLFAFSWLLLLAISGFLYFWRKRTDSKKDKP